MPPQTRTRVTKVLKENREVFKKSKLKSDGKITKPPRKALADKTNSLSDDNASIDIPIKNTKTLLKRKATKTNGDNNVRPRRERRLPPRYVENQVLKNLSNNKDSPAKLNPLAAEVHIPVKKPKNSSSIIEIQTKDSKTYSPGKTNSNTLQSPTKASSKVKENPPKPNKSAKNSDNIVTHTDDPSKDEGIPARNAVKSISANGPSKEGEKMAAGRPMRNCRIQSAIEKPTSKSSNDSSLNESFKTPSKDLESSLVVNRPKRICRLPSKFEDHSISPSKFIPVQPCYASTPIQQKNPKPSGKNTENLAQRGKVAVKSSGKDKSTEKVNLKKPTKVDIKDNSINSSTDKSSPDTNNNGKNKILRTKRATAKTKLQKKQVHPESNKITPFAKRLVDKSLSFRILEDKQENERGDNLDVYEFTFDPNEEPKPQKKKRKKPVKKRSVKPKVVVLKSNYNENVSKALESLKAKVKPSQSQTVQNNVKPTDSNDIIQHNNTKNTTEIIQSSQAITKPVTNDIPQSNNLVSVNLTEPPANETAKNSIHESNYASIRVEDIAADFESIDHHNEINYSPVHSPLRPATPDAPEVNESTINPTNKDPLNLQGDTSFFDDQPVASSSMNVSVRHPLASPWRVEFGTLPMKWHSNTYVKPNMTPAMESSYINSEVMNNTKHVYTNMVPVSELLPEIVDSAPNLKQPSIISFMREVAVRSANKKKRRRSPSPTKASYIFDDVNNASNDFGYKTPKKVKKMAKVLTPNVSDESNPHVNDKSNDKKNSNQSSNKSLSPAKALKKKDKDCTFFGFDENESIDQENVSPVKAVPNTRTRGLRSRTALQEFNTQVGPTRAVMPVAAKAKLTSSEVVEQLYDQLKSAEDVPEFPEKETAKEPADNTVVTNLDNPSWHEEDDDDSQSVHLFEDIEVVHHLKPHRKSYGKSKKVTFQQRSNSDSDTPPRAAAYSSDDDLADLTFQMPNIKQKKVVKKRKPKKQLSKKEEKEVEEWAAGFNSMCEDIDDFALVVE